MGRPEVDGPGAGRSRPCRLALEISIRNSGDRGRIHGDVIRPRQGVRSHTVAHRQSDRIGTGRRVGVRRVLSRRRGPISKVPTPRRHTPGGAIREGHGERLGAAGRRAREEGYRTGRGSRTGVVDHHREVLVGGVAVARDAVARDVRPRHRHGERTGNTGGEEHGLRVVAEVGGAARDRIGARKNVAAVSRSSHGHGQVEIVDVGSPRRGARSVSPAERDAERLSGRRHIPRDRVARPGSAQDLCLIDVHLRRRVEGSTEIHPSHALRVAGEGIVRTDSSHVFGRVDEDRFLHGRTRRREAVVQKVLIHEGGPPGNGGCRVARSARPAVECLAGREVLITNRRPVVVALGNAGLDVSPGRHDLRLPTSVSARAVDGTPRGEADDVVDVVGTRVSDGATVRSGLPVVLGGPHREDVFCGPRRTHRIRSGAVVARRKDDHQLLITAHAAPRVAHDAVVGLCVGIVVRDRVPRAGESPRVRADTSAQGIGRILPGRPVGRRVAENRRGSDVSPWCDPQPVVVSAGVLHGRPRSRVESRHDVGVEKAVASLRPILVRGVAGEVDAGRGEVGMPRQRRGIVHHVHREAAELGGVETHRGQPCQVTRRRGPCARDISGNDLTLPLVETLDLTQHFQRKHARAMGQFRESRGIDFGLDVEVGTHAEDLDDTPRTRTDEIGRLALIRPADDLHGHGDGLSLQGVAPGAQGGSEPPRRLPHACVTHLRHIRPQALEQRDVASWNREHVSVHREVLDDAKSQTFDAALPLVLDGPLELHEIQSCVDGQDRGGRLTDTKVFG